MGAGQGAPYEGRLVVRAPPDYDAVDHRAETRTLAQMGILLVSNLGALRQRGWTAIPNVPVFVAHAELGLCLACAKGTRGNGGERVYYVVRVVNPLAEPGGAAPPLSNDYYAVPERIDHGAEGIERVVFPRAVGIVEFRPYGPPGGGGAADVGNDAGAGAGVDAYGSENAGYVVILNKLGVHYRMPWRVASRLMTLRDGDTRLADKLAALQAPYIRTMADVHAFQAAAQDLMLHAPATSQFLGTTPSDEEAWGALLARPPPPAHTQPAPQVPRPQWRAAPAAAAAAAK